MTIGLVDSARDESAFVSPTERGRAWLRLLASQEVRYFREREDTAIEAEDYWEQAEEVCAVDPIG